VQIGLKTSEGWVDFGFGLVPPAPEPLWLSCIAIPQNLDVTTATSAYEASDAPAPRAVIPTGDYKSEITVPPTKLPEYPDTGLVLERINEQQWRNGSEEVVVGLDGLLPLAAQHRTGTEFKLNVRALDEIRGFLDALSYLRASRKRPSRGYEHFASELRHVGYAGERAASILLNAGNKEQRYVSPPQLPSQKPKTEELHWQESECSLGAATAKWLEYLRLAIKVSASQSKRYGPEYVDVQVQTALHGFARNITEVGFGVSQVLPILVAGLLQPAGGLLIVDLPEAHLHPGPQADIADFFCALVMNGRSVMVETHSEAFFHRLRLRAAMDPALMEKLGIFFIDAPTVGGLCNTPRKIGVTLEEEPQWPVGFFQEALDSELQIRSVRQLKKNG
jgi:predicted ATPase